VVSRIRGGPLYKKKREGKPATREEGEPATPISWELLRRELEGHLHVTKRRPTQKGKQLRRLGRSRVLLGSHCPLKSVRKKKELTPSLHQGENLLINPENLKTWQPPFNDLVARRRPVTRRDASSKQNARKTSKNEQVYIQEEQPSEE